MMATRSSSRRRLSYDSGSQSVTGEPQVCKLCNHLHPHTSQVHTWQSERAREEALKLDVVPNDTICRPCRDDIRRISADPSHVPRWEKRKETVKCCVLDCDDACFSKLQVLDIKKHLEKLHVQLQFAENIPFPTPLCSRHYHIVYQAIQPQQRHCATCRAYVKHDTSRPCPDADKITKHLHDNAAFEGNIEATDRVCLTCYRSHLIILQADRNISYDCDLQSLLDSIKITATNSPNTARELALYKTIIYVGERLLNEMAILLQDAYEFLQQAYNDNSNSQQESEAKLTVSSIWLLGNLTNSLQHHLEYSCASRKHGVLLYRSNANLASLLHKSLYQIRQQRKKEPTNVESTDVHVEPTNEHTNELLFGLNNKILDQCQHFLTRHQAFCEDYSTIDIDQVIIEDINPELWEAICLLTRSAAEKRGLEQVPKEQHKKRLRRFFLLCMIMYCVDDRCSMPMHTMLTDLIESQGGTKLLIQILNKLGICSSHDTLDRHIQSKVSSINKKHLCNSFFNSSSFTVVSVDNIDFLHSFAQVYKGSTNSSWHGTTIQLVQPLPAIEPIQHSQTVSAVQHSQPLSAERSQPLSAEQRSQPLSAEQRSQPLSAERSQPLSAEHSQPLSAQRSQPLSAERLSAEQRSQPLSAEQRSQPLSAEQRSQPLSAERSQPLSAEQRSQPLSAEQHSHSLSAAVQHGQSRSLSRKRTERSSPIQSPLKLTQSPLAKARPRLRSGTERIVELDERPTSKFDDIQHSEHVKDLQCLSITDFITSATENESLKDLHQDIFTYMVKKLAIAQSSSEQTIVNIQDYFSRSRIMHTEKSEVAYFEVMNAVADSKDTLIEVLHSLFDKFIRGCTREFLVIEGDQKLYEVLQSLKFEYGKELEWVIPFPGDWHMLKNFQVAIIKPYFDAGLKDLAKAAGYPVASIEVCGQFKRTHHFLLEAWEALYRVMLTMFFDKRQGESQTIEDPLVAISKQIIENANSCTPRECIAIEAEQFHEFKLFIQELARVDSTWRFWVQFVFQDMNAYVGLFLSIRSGDWPLRTASMKQMAAVFCAFDHPNYRKLISRHIADIVTMPDSVLEMFQQGAFVVSVTGREWHSVGIDEAHEMLINKACKMSIIRPSADYINRIVSYLPYRNKAIENLTSYIFPEDKKHEEPTSVLSKKPDDMKHELNITCQMKAVEDSDMLQYVSTDRGLINPFTKKTATAQQSCDLLSFRTVGQQEFLKHVEFFVLKKPSTASATMRKRRLQTFSSKKVNRQRYSQLEKDRNLILACMRKKIKWSIKTGTPIAKHGEQLIPLPLAISDHNGNPRKGQKSHMTKTLANRYQKQSILLNSYPAGWQQECCILEGMFLINTAPIIGRHRTYGDYAQFLISRFISPMLLKEGCTEVHLLFDNVGQLKNTPKFFEQQRRDELATVATGHNCEAINKSKILPMKWRENLLHCRKCKRTLVCFLAQFILQNIQAHLSSHQKFYVAGAFSEQLTNTCWYVQGNSTPEPDPSYSCNGEESDTMIWLHTTKTPCKRILVVSADTDVYMIGLTLPCAVNKDIIIQISKISSQELKLLSLKNLTGAIHNDPDMANIPLSTRLEVVQTLFVVTGCDYTSFFSGIGKATFFKHFFQHAEFVTGETHYTNGSLAHTFLNNNSYKEGFMAFLRLIGIVYFHKHPTAFSSDSPESHFKGYLSLSEKDKQHRDWLEDIRQSMWARINFEDEMIPSTEALWRHWMRSCWVLDMWRQADKNTMSLAALTDFGWSITDSVLAVDWDSTEHQDAVKERVLLLTKGCKCKTGCITRRCICKRKDQNCSEGCSCLNCLNLQVQVPVSTECDGENIIDMEIEDGLELSSDSDCNSWSDRDMYSEADESDSELMNLHG